MKIIIVGAGKVGYTLASNLSLEYNDIILIDINSDNLSKAENALDVMTLKGNGVSANTLINAGIKNVDLLIAVTGSDEINMLCCLTGKKLGVKSTIARIRDPKYAKELSLFKEDLGLDMVINPEEAAADEIARILTFPGAVKFESFANGRVRLTKIIVKDNMKICNVKIKNIHKITSTSVLIAVVIRDNELIIPYGDFEIKQNDHIYVIGKSSQVYNFCKFVKNTSLKTKNVMIVGGGKITYYLSKLLNEMYINVKIIEINKNICEELSESLPHALILNGDGTDSDLLYSEHIDNIDTFIAMTGHDEENIIASLIAKKNNVEQVITKISRSNYSSIINKLEIDNVITPKEIITDEIIKFIRGNSVETLHRIVDGQGQILEIIAKDTDFIIKKPLSKINLVDGVLIGTIVRKNEVVIPTGKDAIYPGDRVILITSTNNISSLNDIVNINSGGLHSELKTSIKKLGNIISM